MESNEEYFLRALRRTSNGLTDSLIPAHGAKLTRLLNRFESTPSIGREVNALLGVQGFGKCALAMEWLLERTKRLNDFSTPEQFESDILLLNEKLFEAFLNQPFDMPDYSRTFEAPTRPIQQNIELTDDEFIGTSYQSSPSAVLETPAEEMQPEDVRVSAVESMSEPNWSSTPSIAAYESSLTSSSAETTLSDSSPSLSEAMNPELYESSERIAQNAVEFIDKPSSDRPIAMAVIRVTIRAAVDIAKNTNNVIVQDFFEAMLRLIAYADEQGKIRSDQFADVIRDIGDRLMIVLKAPSGGITILKNITLFMADPKELLQKK
ncbi:MAG: hypothetical protein KA247_05465 [Bacteroidetes bacterium]|nr:hypothetical protein [Bacteroidota bacterium]